MSSDTLHKFIVYAPDKTDEGAFERRLSVRPKHLENAAKLTSEKVILLGGAMLTPESLTGADKKMIGSTIIYAAKTLEEVKAIVESDIYYTSGVWDPERLVILPFVSATPFP
ncbi:YCII domain-containing protein [Favolaschia claudopus]|uniref:YCII domain-containing protein n=1 Tax=Favolaschia claudopus TaxID=2862362 RepID=A0AAW0E730_9AGAR